MEAFRAGDSGGAESAASEIFEELSPRLRRFLRSRGVDDAGVEDILQKVFIRLFRSLDRVRDGGSLFSYAATIAKNEAKRPWGVLSRIKSWFLRFSDDPEGAEDAIAASIEPIIVPSDEEEERRVALERALKWLKSQDRRSFVVFGLINYREMKPGEVAERLGIKASLVYTIHLRAKERLRKRFHEELSRFRRQRKDGNEPG